MQGEVFAHSPLLVFPLVATLMFVFVWVAVAVHAMTRPDSVMSAAARAPLEPNGDPPATHPSSERDA